MSHLLLDSFDILPPRDHQGCGGVTGDMQPDASKSGFLQDLVELTADVLVAMRLA